MKIQNLLFIKQGKKVFSSLISFYIGCDVFISFLMLYSFGQKKHLWVSADSPPPPTGTWSQPCDLMPGVHVPNLNPSCTCAQQPARSREWQQSLHRGQGMKCQELLSERQVHMLAKDPSPQLMLYYLISLYFHNTHSKIKLLRISKQQKVGMNTLLSVGL